MKLFKKKSFDFNTFTKVWVSRNMILSWLCILMCFGLAFLGREQIAETLACAIVANIVGVMTTYFAKSFFETREQERMNLKKMEMDLSTDTNPPTDDPNNMSGPGDVGDSSDV